ncbi:MAG: patatin-like phospholipase family protein [Actinoplanes sp.]
MSGSGRVLGGGGVTGVAWEIGLLHGLAEQGVDLTGADLTVGTSAGSVVAAQLLSGVPLADLYAAQLAPPTGEIAAQFKIKTLLKYAVAGLWPGDPAAGRAWLGRQALKARTVPEAERRAVIAGRVRTEAWPAAELLITAVEAETGSFTVFDRSSGVSLIDAVHASCAVPLTWPPATVNGVRYIDGGMRSVANVDLARGCDRVVVIAPITGSVRPAGRPKVQAARLEVPHVVIAPTDLALSKMGRNPLDPAFRAAAAEAGKQQAVREGEKISEVWKEK